MATLQARGLVKGEALTDEGRRLRSDVEDLTDRLVQPVVNAIGPGPPG